MTIQECLGPARRMPVLWIPPRDPRWSPVVTRRDELPSCLDRLALLEEARRSNEELRRKLQALPAPLLVEIPASLAELQAGFLGITSRWPTWLSSTPHNSRVAWKISKRNRKRRRSGNFGRYPPTHKSRTNLKLNSLTPKYNQWKLQHVKTHTHVCTKKHVTESVKGPR